MVFGDYEVSYYGTSLCIPFKACDKVTEEHHQGDLW